MKSFLFIFSIVAFLTSIGQIGLVNNSDNSKIDYVLFHPNASTSTYLLNKSGQIVHEWVGSYNPGVRVQLLESGSLLRTGKVISNFNMGGGWWLCGITQRRFKGYMVL